MGGHPQPPHLLVYRHLKHLGLHRMGQPLEATLNALTFQRSSWLHAEEGDGPAWEPGGPTEGPFVWEIAELVSSNSAHPAVILGGGEVCFPGHTCGSSRLLEPKCLAVKRKKQAVGQERGWGGWGRGNTVPPSFESCF